MKAAAYMAAVILVVAGVLHIGIIFLIPAYASKDAWSQLSENAGRWTFNIVAMPEQETPTFTRNDPALGVAACLFDLNEAPVRVEAGGDLPFWSVAVFDRRGQNIYSVNDRTAIERELLMVVVNPVQRARLRKNPTEDLEQALIVESNSSEGFVLLRALQSDRSWTPQIERFLRDARCERYEMPDENGPSQG